MTSGASIFLPKIIPELLLHRLGQFTYDLSIEELWLGNTSGSTMVVGHDLGVRAKRAA
jgi:hypothetical protein